jgi:predicted metal-dependent phosphoesterase TrpH
MISDAGERTQPPLTLTLTFAGATHKAGPALTTRSRRGTAKFTNSCDLQGILGRMSRADLHCHSSASEVSKLGVQRALGLPECATTPEEVYALAKRRGMDFVTITDHDTIDGCLEIADRDDVFISEELTTWFRGEPQAVHVLCFGLTPDDHARLQQWNRDLEACAEYLHSHGIACSLAHPFYAVEAPLSPAHRRQLAQLFPVWETRNGSRARELNMPAAIYIETHGGTGTGGSDDHAGVDIGRTFTETPPAATPEEFLRHIREGRADARGEQGSAAKWAHAAMALATRALDADSDRRQMRAPDPDSILKIAERVMSEGDLRRGEAAGDLGPEDARALLAAFVESVDVEPGRALIDHMQSDDFSHAELARRARRVHERRLQLVVDEVVQSLARGEMGSSSPPGHSRRAASCSAPRFPPSLTRRRPPSSGRRRPS